ncbi:hypothetical protein [Haloarchaeobius litoreus]|uniref:Tat (Twin-arginine translocation) pathway signal sequence n=1 Tax=Haloarchaeobius litoreus TaxID=755306 RepID=A0ABD6DPZ9_9EURY|nr:hypothetical protein [Haloarchaeobius litoreus]
MASDRDEPMKKQELIGSMDDGSESVTEQPEDDIFSRRKVLGGLSAGAASLGFTGIASAIDPTGDVTAEIRRQEIISQYQPEEDAIETVNEEASELLEYLRREGYIESADVAEVNHDRVQVYTDNKPVPADGTEEEAQEQRAHIHIRKETEDRTIGINVEPEVGRQYAVIIPTTENSDEATVISITDGEIQSDDGCYYLDNACTTGVANCGCRERDVVCCTKTLDCYTNGGSLRYCCCPQDSYNCCHTCFGGAC